ncbi:MAG: hypothetical protein Ct9H90mP13_11420 [Pseudomonadota bacterium]|nr:MAG: hypothetical protein Ct9H90mP13_11420 [Pseudomonadota bacterium]
MMRIFFKILERFCGTNIKPFITITESTLMISMGYFSANFKESSVFPEAVGPLMIMAFLAFKTFLLKVRHHFFANNIQRIHWIIM